MSKSEEKKPKPPKRVPKIERPKPRKAKFNGALGALVINGVEIEPGTIVTGTPASIAALCTRKDCEPIYEPWPEIKSKD